MPRTSFLDLLKMMSKVCPEFLESGDSLLPLGEFGPIADGLQILLADFRDKNDAMAAAGTAVEQGVDAFRYHGNGIAMPNASLEARNG